MGDLMGLIDALMVYFINNLNQLQDDNAVIMHDMYVFQQGTGWTILRAWDDADTAWLISRRQGVWSR